MEIRKANANDVDALVELRKRQLIDERQSTDRDIDAELKEYFTCGLTDNSFIAWLAVEDDIVIATSGLCFYQLPPHYSNPSGMIAYVTNMFTLKPYRRKGIASSLLSKILDEARSLGHSSVRLHASSDGRPLYEKFGFTSSDGYMALKLY